MALSNSALSYTDCKEFLEKALDSDTGSRIPFREEKGAKYFQMRCNQYRSIDRDDSKLIYDQGHQMFGKSAYDVLTLTIKLSPDGFAWVYAQQRTLPEGLVEPIAPDDPAITLADFTEVHLLEDQSNGDETTS